MAAAGAFLLDPDHAVAAGGCLRPVALHALSHALDALLASAASSANDRPARAGGASETPPKRKGKTGAGARVDEAADAVATRHERACARSGCSSSSSRTPSPSRRRYLRCTPPPFARLVAEEPDGGGGTRSDAADHHPSARARALLVVRACVRLLRVFARDGVGGASAAVATRAPADHTDADPESATALAPAPDTGGLSHWDLTRLVRFLRHLTPRSAGPSPWRSSERSVFPPLPRDSARDRPPPQSSATPSPRREEIPDAAVALERAAAVSRSRTRKVRRRRRRRRASALVDLPRLPGTFASAAWNCAAAKVATRRPPRRPPPRAVSARWRDAERRRTSRRRRWRCARVVRFSSRVPRGAGRARRSRRWRAPPAARFRHASPRRADGFEIAPRLVRRRRGARRVQMATGRVDPGGGEGHVGGDRGRGPRAVRSAGGVGPASRRTAFVRARSRGIRPRGGGVPALRHRHRRRGPIGRRRGGGRARGSPRGSVGARRRRTPLG